MIGATAAAEKPLAKRGDVGVVSNGYGKAGALGKECFKRDIDEALQIWRLVNQTGASIHGAGSAHAHAKDRFFRQVTAYFGNKVRDLVHDRSGTFRRGGIGAGMGDNVALLIAPNGAHLRAT
jgi:hypothetical protein